MKTNDPMTYGLEECNQCDWKNIFWVVDGSPVSRLMTGGAPCPACASTATFRAELAIPTPASIFLSEQEIQLWWSRRPMSPKQHMRAAIRWVLPYERGTRELAFCATFVVLSAAVATAPWSGFADTKLAAGLVYHLWLLFAVWRMFTTITFLLIDISQHGSQLIYCREMWSEFGQQPLLADFARRREERRAERRLREHLAVGK